MSRLVTPTTPPLAGPVPGPGGGGNNGQPVVEWLERVAKYIPGEIVVVYKGTFGVLNQLHDDEPLKVPVAWLVFAVCLVMTPAYLSKMNKESGSPAPWDKVKPQLAIATVSFVIWAYAIGGPFALGGQYVLWGGYREWLGGIILGLYTLVVGVYKP